MSKITEIQNTTPSEENPPKITKPLTPAEKCPQGTHISHFRHIFDSIDDRDVMSLAIGRLSDNGQDYDEVELSGERTPIEIKSNIGNKKETGGLREPSEPLRIRAEAPTVRGY